MVHDAADRFVVAFDDERVVANAGVMLPALLAGRLGIEALVDGRVDLGDGAGSANPGRKVMTLVSAMALGADCNPGTSYTTNLPFCLALAVRELRMTPAEAVWSATAGGAKALRRTDIGVLTPGARADAIALDAALAALTPD